MFHFFHSLFFPRPQAPYLWGRCQTQLDCSWLGRFSGKKNIWTENIFKIILSSAQYKRKHFLGKTHLGINCTQASLSHSSVPNHHHLILYTPLAAGHNLRQMLNEKHQNKRMLNYFDCFVVIQLSGLKPFDVVISACPGHPDYLQEEEKQSNHRYSCLLIVYHRWLLRYLLVLAILTIWNWDKNLNPEIDGFIKIATHRKLL